MQNWSTASDGRPTAKTTILCDLHEAAATSAATDPPPLEGDPETLPEATARRARFLRDVRRWSRNLGRSAMTHFDPETAERVVKALDQAKKDLFAERRAEWWLDASRPSALLFCCGVVERARRNSQHINN